MRRGDEQHPDGEGQDRRAGHQPDPVSAPRGACAVHHGGEARVTSPTQPDGTGTSFTITVPILEEAAAEGRPSLRDLGPSESKDGA